MPVIALLFIVFTSCIELLSHRAVEHPQRKPHARGCKGGHDREAQPKLFGHFSILLQFCDDFIQPSQLGPQQSLIVFQNVPQRATVAFRFVQFLKFHCHLLVFSPQVACYLSGWQLVHKGYPDIGWVIGRCVTGQVFAQKLKKEGIPSLRDAVDTARRAVPSLRSALISHC
jgi:hypothetical protein